MFSPEIVDDPEFPILIFESKFEKNLENISTTAPLSIPVKLGITENIHIGVSCSFDEIQTFKALFKELCEIFSWPYEEMLGINLSIVVQEIKTYLDVKPIGKRLRPLHPRKIIVIKVEVQKILKVGFIYLVLLND